jgi:hypothetical protein
MPKLSPQIEDAIQRAAQAQGVDPARLRAFVMIESGGNPNNATGSYKGLLQLSGSEFARHGGQGSIFDVNANLNAGAIKLKAESADFERRYGRPPTAGEVYMQHQQGTGGAAAHWANPDKPAWQNMASTAEGRQKGPGWARQAIWGNVPSDVRKQYGSVDNITSREFTDLWNTKVARLGGDNSLPSGDNSPTPPPKSPSYSLAGIGGDASASASLPPAPGVASATQPPGGTAAMPSGGGAGPSLLSSLFSKPTTPSATGGGALGGIAGALGGLGSALGGGGDGGAGKSFGQDAAKAHQQTMDQAVKYAEAVNAEYDKQQSEILKRMLARRLGGNNGLVG